MLLFSGKTGTVRQKDTLVALYAALVTFLTYATVYAFRKPFTVGSFEQEPMVFGVHYKDALFSSVFSCFTLFGQMLLHQCPVM